jgi:hypothetical protein
MKSSVKDREYDAFRPASNDKSKKAVVIEQDVFNPIPVEMDVQDSFNRLKVAPPHLLFDSSFQYSLQEKVFIRDTLAGATITHDSARAAARLDCSSSAGSRARFRSRNYFPYSPAFTNTVTASFNMHGSVIGVTKRIGMYDENNGYILEAHNGIIRVGIRSSISGSTNYVNQSSFNVDTLDGSGPSGITLDISKQQILVIQYQWLGSGQVIFSMSINGTTIPFHKFNHANILTGLYSKTGTLPVQAEILNTSGSASYMEFTCCSVVSNGATAQHGHLHSISSGVTPKNMPTTGVSYPIISLRKQSGFTDIPVQILDMNAFSTSQDDFIIQIIHKPTLTGAVWTNVPNSYCQKDVSATTATGGDIVAEFYMKGNLQASEKLDQLAKFWDLTLGNDFAGNSEIMTMSAIPLTTNASMYGVISYKEFE